MIKSCEKCSRCHEGTYGSGRFCSQKCAKARSGEDNPNYGKECKPETRKKISDSNKGKKFTKEHKRRLSEVNSCSEGRTENRGSKAGWIGGLWFHSSWEVGFYLHYLEKLKLPVVRNCRANGLKGFPYLFEGSLRTYYPDFYLPDSDEWVEVKGCFFDDRDKAKTEAKIRQFPHKLTLIQGDEMKPYLTYAEETYGKDFSSVLYDCQPEPNQELYETLNQ